MFDFDDKSYSEIESIKMSREDNSLLKLLLKDYTTNENIKWATNSYIANGPDFLPDKEIKNNLVTGWYADLLVPDLKKFERSAKTTAK